MSTQNFARVLLLCLAVGFSCAARADEAKIPDGMILVPAGEFTFGTNESESIGPDTPRSNNDARPQQKTTLPAFYIDKTEVTNAQYKKYCDAVGYPAPPHWKNGNYPNGEDDFPVSRVSWFEAGAFAAWAGKRLPTELEWEKSARGTDARQFPWGNNWDEGRVVWNRSKSDKVGQFPNGASPYGVLDMAGNVFEWTASWYDAYPNAPIKFAEYGEQMKVIRGGGYSGYESIARTYYRSVAFPTSRSEWLGFRCALDAK